MTIEVHESDSNEIKIVKRGNKLRSLFFVILGSLFQILFIWGYWSFLDTTGPLAFFWFGLINSELFPFISVLFLFGGGCFLIAIREIGWIESWIIKENLFQETSGVQKRWQLFRWCNDKKISNNQICAIRIHKVPLDRIKYYNRYQLEIDYQDPESVSIISHVIFVDDSESAAANTMRLAEKIKSILSFSKEIERSEAPFISQGNEKKRKSKEVL